MGEKRVKRREARVIALKTVFYYLEREASLELKTCFDYVLTELEEQPANDFAWDIAHTAVDNLGKIKVIVRAFAPEFEFDKIAPINRALLVLGIGEMKFMQTPPVVVINEYIELAKEYGEDKSPAFVNGVLDNYRKGLGLDRTKEDR